MLRGRVDGTVTTDGLAGVTSKLTISDCDLYLKTAWLDGRIVHLDLTISRGGRELDQSAYYLARSWVEDSCRMASKLLLHGVSIGEIVSGWRGIEGYPSGYCPQLQGLMKGPLHAVALLIEKRHDEWREKIDLLSRRDAERKIQEVKEVVEG